MNVHLSPDLENALAAARRGVSIEILVREAVERLVDHDEWFIREVRVGLVQIDTGQVLTHEAVGACLATRLAAHSPRR